MNLDKLKDAARRHELREDWRKAIEIYQRALGELAQGGEPADPSLYNRIGDLELKAGEPASALLAYEQAAETYADQGFFNNAIALCGKILRVNPGRTTTYLRLAELNASRNVVAEARRNLGEYVERMTAAGQLNQAAVPLRKFAERFGGSPELRSTLDDLLETLKRRGGQGIEEITHALGATEESRSLRASAGAGEREGQSAPNALIFLDTGVEIPGLIRDHGLLGSAGLEESEPEPESGLTLEAQPPPEVEPLPYVEPTAMVETEPGSEDTPGLDDLEPTLLAEDDLAIGSIKSLVTQDTPETVDVAGLQILTEFVAPEVQGLELEPAETETDPEPEADEPFTGFREERYETPESTDLPLEPPEQEPAPSALFAQDDIAPAAPEPVAFEPEAFEPEAFEPEAFEPAPLEFEAVEPEPTEPEPAAPEPAAEAPPTEPPGRFDPESMVLALEPLFDELEVEAESADTGPATSALREHGVAGTSTEELEHAVPDLVAEERWIEALEALGELTRREPDRIELHQHRVELAYRSGDRRYLTDAYLSLAQTLERLGVHENAVLVYHRVLDHDEGNPAAEAALVRLRPAPPPPAPHAAPPPPAPAPPADVPSSPGQFVDLGALILEPEPDRDTRMRVEAREPVGDEDADFRETLAQFKQGLEANVEVGDFRTHHDLGIAFMEMGLLDEAIAQFQKSLRAPETRLSSAESLGQVFYEQGRFGIAEAVLSRAVDTLPGGDDEKIGLIYWRGRALEAQGRRDDALRWYERALAVDITFLDLSERVQRLSAEHPS